MHVLVCGGAGYIGSHMCKHLATAGHRVTVLDNLSTGHRQAVQWGELVEADIRIPGQLDRAFENSNFDAVMHFSALSLVGESTRSPAEYYENNVLGTWHLLQAMRQAGIKRFIFSSTAAVYGTPESDNINETHPTRPINPYGHSKLAVEFMLRDYAAAYGLQSASLRYFNAAGASADGEIGEAHNPETHLIPNVLKSALSQGAQELKVFGNDYPTRDGSCIRDYIHVEDLADAHLLALQYLETHPGAEVFNLGNGTGFSVFEVIAAASDSVGRPLEYRLEGRRAGDPPILVADASKARQILGWTPKLTNIGGIIDSAWVWHQKPAFV